MIPVVAAIALAAIGLIIFYRKTIRPMKIIKLGMDLVREQDFASRLRHVGQSNADQLVDMFNEMMERLKHERLRVREQNEFLDLLINASPTGIILLNDAGLITMTNQAAKDILGIRNPEGMTIGEIDSPITTRALQLHRGETATVKANDDREIYRLTRLGFMDRGWTHPFIVIERLTQEVREAEQRAYTKVIRMMAHEVNNSVGGISSTLQSIESEIGTSDPVSRLIGPIRACTERADSLMGFIKAYAEIIKIPDPKLKLTDFCALVESSLPLLESICNRCGASLSSNLEDAQPLRLDPVLMQQVMVNVVKNAAENAGHGGHVTIIADERKLTVINDGPELTQEVSERLFKDVFTTKPDGHGLGLMLVGEILRKHGAVFSLKSENGMTKFSMAM